MAVMVLASCPGLAFSQVFPESAHNPYPPSLTESRAYTVTAAAPAIDVVFDQMTEFEPGADFLDVKDGTGQPIAGSPFTGLDLAGRTVRVPGRTVRFVLRTDASDPPGRQFYGYRVTSIVAAPSDPPTITTTTIPSGRVGSVYSVQLQSRGGVPPLSWSILLADPVPDGLALQPSGLLVGIPRTAAVSTFTVLVADAESHADTQVLTLQVNPSGAGPYLSSILGTPSGDSLPVTLQLNQLPQGFPLLREALAVLAFEPTALRYQSFTQGSSASPSAARVFFSGLVGEGAFSAVILGQIGPSGPVGTAAFQLLKPFPADQSERDRLAFLTLTRLQTRDGEVIFTFPPTADAGFDQVVELDAHGRLSAPDPTLPITQANRHRSWVTLDGRRSVDPLGRPLTYYWRREDGSTTGIASSSQAVATFTTAVTGIYRFTLQVKNGLTFSAPDRVTVRVEGPGKHAPLARFSMQDADTLISTTDLGTPLVVAVNNRLVLDARKSTDADLEHRDRLSYLWTISGLLDGKDRASANPTFIASQVGSYNVELTVTDPTGLASKVARQHLIVRPVTRPAPRLTLTALSSGTSQAGRELGNATLSLTRAESLEALLLTTVTLKAVLSETTGPVTPTFDFGWSVIEGPQAEMPQTTASVVNVRLTTPGVHLFECVAREALSGQETGVTTRSRIRVLAKSDSIRVPQAVAQTSVRGKRKTGFSPAALPGGGLQVQIGDVVQLDATSSTARSNSSTVEQVRWEQVAGPEVKLSDPTSLVTTFVAPDLRVSDIQALVFNLFVDDGRVRSEPDPVSVQVLPAATMAVPISLQPGLNLLGLTAEPAIDVGLARSQDLLDATGASYLMCLAPGADGRGRFEALFPDMGGADFVLEAGRGLLVFNPSVTALVGSLPGREWTQEAKRTSLHRGLNVVGYSSVPTDGRTAQGLCALTKASFVTRLQSTSGGGVDFETYLPGAGTPSFTLEPGKAYIVNVPSAMELVP